MPEVVYSDLDKIPEVVLNYGQAALVDQPVRGVLSKTGCPYLTELARVEDFLFVFCPRQDARGGVKLC